MIGPLQVGRPNKHVNASYGADNNSLKFYVTEYSSRIGIDDFKPSKGHHVGTGYQSNLRPGVYYSRKLDNLDNPVMGGILSKNYKSLTHTDFRPTKDNDGREPLPSKMKITSTGFAKDQHRTTPSEREAYSMFPDLAMAGYKQKLPLLYQLKKRDPIMEENDNRGPAYHSSENHTQFVKKNPHVDLTDKMVGAKDETGFTRSKNDEPVTHYPDSCYYGGSQHSTLKHALNPLIPSEMKSSFLPAEHANGNEKLGNLNTNGNAESGFTRFILPKGSYTSADGKVYTKLSDTHPMAIEKIKKSDPAEFANLNHPNPYPSLSKLSFTGRNIDGQDAIDKLSRTTYGKKENTGHTENNKEYCTPSKDSQRFSTLYNGEYYNKNKKPMDIHSRVNGTSIKDLQDNGFTRSEPLHPPSNSYDVAQQLKFLHPYVNRSLKARFPSYGENLYSHTQRNVLID